MNLRRAAFAASLLLPWLSMDSALAQSPHPSDPNRECETCEDLCALVDQYWQKELGIKVWQKYAASNTLRTMLRPGSSLNQFEKIIYEQELPKAWKDRPLPCKLAEGWQNTNRLQAPLQQPGPEDTGLETKAFQGPSCNIVWRNAKLEGDIEKHWRSTHVCKGSADAELAHEQVHQKICLQAWAQDPANAASDLAQPENVAESELQAWKRHRNQLRDQIQRLAHKCGWQPTKGQKNDPNAVPTPTQTKKMEERGWHAFQVLTSSPP